MNVLGISCYYHDAAACLVRDGVVLAAAEEERFSRRKHDARFPRGATAYCLEAIGGGVADLDAVVFYEKPLRRLERVLRVNAAHPGVSDRQTLSALRLLACEGLRLEEVLDREFGYRGPVYYSEHHLSHAASAFYPSPFEEATVLTLDGVGEEATTALFAASGASLEPLHEIRYPHSLGLFYAALTAFLGFRVNDDEYKVMGLASYGRPSFAREIGSLIRLRDDGGFDLDLDAFSFVHDEGRMFSDRMIDRLGPPRLPNEPITERHKDLAASLQQVTEEAILHVVRAARRMAPSRNLCLAGGVAHNCVANWRIKREGGFEGLFIQPASGDSGGAMGAALFGYHNLDGGRPRSPRSTHSTCLGPQFGEDEVRAGLERHGLSFRRFEADALCEETASLIHDDFIVGWFQGPMEFGPRALGRRSILANPCNPDMMDILNARVKFREDFRPFAPAIIEESASLYFDIEEVSPYMLLVPKVHPHMAHRIPSVTHVDGTARVQTVSHEENPLFHDLISAFGRRSGVPVVINTSFNIRGEPIVCSPDDAIRCFLHTDIDYLVIGPFIVGKN